MGNPDLPTPPHILEKLVETVSKPRTNRYSASRGIAGLRRAQAGYYARRFGVKLDPEREVGGDARLQGGFANMAQAITAPGDVVLVPNPSYPIHAFGFLMAGGAIRHVPAEPGPEFFHALERAVHHSIPKPIAVILCYPANPTATVADLDFYRDVVAFARRNEVFVLSDLAYAEVYFDDDNPPPSVLQVPGALDVTVEFTSMSKTFSMAGLRMGFAVGNQRLIAALSRVKSYLDYGAYTPVQVAASAALNGPDACIHEMRGIYRKRRDVMVDCFARTAGPSRALCLHVRLGADPGAICRARQPGIFQAFDRESGCRRSAGSRLRRAWRRPCADRAGGRTSNASGRAGPQYGRFPCLG
jgi:alanine-synthesizing transaminase